MPEFLIEHIAWEASMPDLRADDADLLESFEQNAPVADGYVFEGDVARGSMSFPLTPEEALEFAKLARRIQERVSSRL